MNYQGSDDLVTCTEFLLESGAEATSLRSSVEALAGSALSGTAPYCAQLLGGTGAAAGLHDTGILSSIHIASSLRHEGTTAGHCVSTLVNACPTVFVGAQDWARGVSAVPTDFGALQALPQMSASLYSGIDSAVLGGCAARVQDHATWCYQENMWLLPPLKGDFGVYALRAQDYVIPDYRENMGLLPSVKTDYGMYALRAQDYMPSCYTGDTALSVAASVGFEASQTLLRARDGLGSAVVDAASPAYYDLRGQYGVALDLAANPVWSRVRFDQRQAAFVASTYRGIGAHGDSGHWFGPDSGNLTAVQSLSANGTLWDRSGMAALPEALVAVRSAAGEAFGVRSAGSALAAAEWTASPPSYLTQGMYRAITPVSTMADACWREPLVRFMAEFCETLTELPCIGANALSTFSEFRDLLHQLLQGSSVHTARAYPGENERMVAESMVTAVTALERRVRNISCQVCTKPVPPSDPVGQRAASTRPLAEWAGGEQVTLAIVFTDVVGSTALSQEVRDEAMHEVRRAHFAQSRRLIEQFGGREIKTIGDSFMVAFRDVGSVLDYARGLQDKTGHPRIHIRAGIHIGPMRVEENDLFGSTVDFAHRVVEAIKGAEIWLSDRAKEDLDRLGARKHRPLKWVQHKAVVMKKGFENSSLWSLLA